MVLNKASGNMYDGWVTHTWNPLRGECQHKCSYCWVNDLKRKPALKAKYSGPYALDGNAMRDNLKSGNSIFVCSCNDLFEENVDCTIITKILNKCRENPSNSYVYQSKNPGRFVNYLFPILENGMNLFLGTTIETNRSMDAISKAPSPQRRAQGILYVPHNAKTFITIEPILDFDLDEMVELIRMAHPNFVNIGADSKKCGLPEPDNEKVLALIYELAKFTEVKQKSNLVRILTKQS